MNEIKTPTKYFIKYITRKKTIVFSLYAFTLLLIVHLLSTIRNGGFELAKEKWLMVGLFVLFTEASNQFTYWYAKRNSKKASIIKGFLFWFIFTILMFVYIHLLLKINTTKAETINWIINTPKIIVYFLVALCLPFYSFCTDIRFLLLYGTYKLKN